MRCGSDLSSTLKLFLRFFYFPPQDSYTLLPFQSKLLYLIKQLRLFFSLLFQAIPFFVSILYLDFIFGLFEVNLIYISQCSGLIFKEMTELA